MRWSSVLSTQSNPDVALEVLIEAIREEMNGVPPDLMLVFASGHPESSWEVFNAELLEDLGPRAAAACYAKAARENRRASI